MTILKEYDLAEEEGEELYMLEVVVDRVGVREDRVTAAQDPVLPVIARIKFGDFPVMEVERNQLLLVEGKDNHIPKWSSAGESRVSGLPAEWRVREEGEHYDVEVPYMDTEQGVPATIEVRLPKAVLASGEGLRYVLGSVRQMLPPEIYLSLQERVAHLATDRETRGVTHHSFSAGKSCLFHMLPSELVASMAEYPVTVQIFRSSSEGNEFVHSLVGEGKVLLGIPFTRAVLLACIPEAMHPITAHVDSTYPMVDNFDVEVGDMHLFLRLSCFGPAPFQNEENDEMRKQRFLKNYVQKRPAAFGTGQVDMKYPWKKNLGMVPERLAPRPRLQPLFEAEDVPPPPLPQFDFGEFLTNVPRCTPFTQPPCYRKAGDPPLSRCTKEMENQLRREELTKGFQTDPMPTTKPLDPGVLKAEEPARVGNVDPNKCTCPTIPNELRPSDQEGKPNLQCTCATIMQAIASPQTEPPAPPEIVQTNKRVNSPVIPKSQPLGDSDYEITLTKTDCGLEEKKKVGETTSAEKGLEPAPKPQKIQNEPSKKFESGKTVLAEEVAKHKEAKRMRSESKEKIESGINPESLIDVPYETNEHEEVAVKRKYKTLYEATPGMYPGRQYGHRRCVSRVMPVPKHMGWLWSAVNFEGLLKRRGWFPGSIRKDVNNMLNKIKEDAASTVRHGGASGGSARFRSKQRPASKGGAAADVVKYNPNLHVHKKGGFYYVTMIPVKTQAQEDEGIEPAPIEYKIDPKHPNGSDSSYGEDSDSSSSSNVKSYEMNFIVPLAMQAKKKKVDRATAGVQYNENDYLKKGAKKSTGKPGTTETAAKDDKKTKKGKGKKGKTGKKGKKK